MVVEHTTQKTTHKTKRRNEKNAFFIVLKRRNNFPVHILWFQIAEIFKLFFLNDAHNVSHKKPNRQ